MLRVARISTRASVDLTLHPSPPSICRCCCVTPVCVLPRLLPIAPQSLSVSVSVSFARRSFAAKPGDDVAKQHERWLRSQNRARDAAAKQAAARAAAGIKPSAANESAKFFPASRKSSGSGSSGDDDDGDHTSTRKKPRRSLEDYTLAAVVIANAYLYIVWTSATGGGGKLTWAQLDAKNNETHQYMSKYFRSSLRNLQENRWYTLLTSSFAHYRLDHLLVNMGVFLLVARGVVKVTGSKLFMPLYLLGSVAAGFSALVVEDVLKQKHPQQLSVQCGHIFSSVTGFVGASGSVIALTTVWLLNYRDFTKTINFRGKPVVVPIGTLLIAAGLSWTTVEVLALVNQCRGAQRSSESWTNAGHLAAVIAAIVFYFAKFRTPAARATAALQSPFASNAAAVVPNPLLQTKVVHMSPKITIPAPPITQPALSVGTFARKPPPPAVQLKAGS